MAFPLLSKAAVSIGPIVAALWQGHWHTLQIEHVACSPCRQLQLPSQSSFAIGSSLL
jgi:hypothetical protein